MSGGIVVLVAIVLGCEVAFWTFLVLGLLVRYLLRRRALSTVLLLGAPLSTVVMLVASTIDLATGGAAGFAHVLGAIAVAIAIVSGKHHLHAADRWVQRRLGRGPEPATDAAPAPRPGQRDWAHARRQRQGFYRRIVEWALAVGLMAAGAAITAFDPARSQQLLAGMGFWTVILAIDFLISFSYTLSPRKAKAERA